jgi:hypothetical protein
MKNLTIGLIAASTVFLLSAMVALAQDTSASISPGPIGPGNTGPNTYLVWRGIDIGIDVDGSGSSINEFNIRNANYAFTGEKIFYYVLVRDENGAADINQVSWMKDGTSQEGPCSEIPVVWSNALNGTDSNAYVCAGKVNTDSPTAECSNHEQPVFINDATNLLYDNQTDKVFQCQLTVESGWSGAGQIKVSAKDQGGLTGSTLAESWTFNPPLSISLTTSDGQPLSFGAVQLDQAVPGITSPNCLFNIGQDLDGRNCKKYDPDQAGQKLCDISFSNNKLVLTNTGLPDLWPFIASTNFYASNGMAKCPFSNELSANQFEYYAIQGSWNSGWRVMPQLAPNLGCSDPSDGQCRGGCRITEGSAIDVLSPSHSTEIALKIVWPTPCIGTFDTGTIYTIVRAV